MNAVQRALQFGRPAQWAMMLAIGLNPPFVQPGGSTGSSSHASAQQEEFGISMTVDFVELHMTVRDGQGNLVLNLQQQDLVVYEDGVKQEIRRFAREDVPVSVGLLVDHSGSMNRKLEAVSEATKRFIQASKAEDEMFVVNFNDKVHLPLGKERPFTNKQWLLMAAIAADPTEGMTTLYDAVEAGLKHLERGSHTKKMLLVMSDGSDNASKRNLEQVMTRAARSKALIYAIGLFAPDDPDRNDGVLRRLAKGSGGEAYFPQKLETVGAMCERIANEIRNQYSIGYVSSGSGKAGDYRQVRVVAKRADQGKLQVRVRAGYQSGQIKEKEPWGQPN